MIADFLMLHLLFCSLFLVYAHFFKKISGNRLAAEAILLLLLPLIGLSLLIFRYFSSSSPKSAHIIETFYDDLQGHSPKLNLNRHKKSDILPISDILLFEDQHLKRKILTNAIKDNQLNSHTVLRDAIRDSDSEIAHYAVSVMTTNLANKEFQMTRLRKKLLQSPHDLSLMKRYATTLQAYLRNNILDPESLNKWSEEYYLFLEKLLEHDPGDKLLWIEKIELALKKRDYISARKYGLSFYKRFPDQEEPYLLYMHYCHLNGRYALLQSILKRFKASQIPFSPFALETVRFWDAGGHHAS